MYLRAGWTFTFQKKIPDPTKEDLGNFLQIEPECRFPYGLDALLISNSKYRSPSGEVYATQVAVPRDQAVRLEKALRAAKLKPVSFSLGIAALQTTDNKTSGGVLALAIGETGIGGGGCFGRRRGPRRAL